MAGDRAYQGAGARLKMFCDPGNTSAIVTTILFIEITSYFLHFYVIYFYQKRNIVENCWPVADKSY